MKKLALLMASVALLVLSAQAGMDLGAQCLRAVKAPPSPDSPEYRKYAPDRTVQILHLAVDVTPDFQQHTIQAKAVLRFKPIAKPTQEIRLDAIDLDVSSLTATAEVQCWQLTDEGIIVTFARPIDPEREVLVTVVYSAEPTSGLYFRTPDMGYKPGDSHLFSQGEEIEARHWYPCLDSPNQMFTSEVTCRVPEGMTVISNGRLVSQRLDPATGLTAFHWKQDKPHANYLISLVAGYFKKLEDTCHGVPLAFFTPPSEIAQAASSFRDTKDMVAFFEEDIGVPYPWDKYYQVCVNDFVAGGMENTSATTLTDGTLFTDATENIRSSEGLVAHELAHQWFGDLVTCKDWSHTWLNESFATYYETLYAGHKHGRDALLYELYGRARQITGISDDRKPIVRRTYDSPGEMFGYLSYPKGSWVLHMLRAQLGEDLFRRCIKAYLERHKFGNVVTEDLRSVLEELSGRSFDQFFDQWLYHGRFPELEIGYSWDEVSKLARVSIAQKQQIDADVLLFNFPLTVRFKGGFGTLDRTVQVAKRQEDFYFALPSPPDLVRVDPEYTLLAKINFHVPQPMLALQLADRSDTIGRLLAVEQLGARKDKESIGKLRQALNEDPFYGVRIEASRALRSMHTDDSLGALLASTSQPDARVRLEVTEDIGGFYGEQSFDYACRLLERENNPAIQAAAICGIGGYAKPSIHQAILKFLNSQSYRNELADAAISACELQDDSAYLAPVLQTLTNRGPEFTSHGFAKGLRTAAYLARNETDKKAVREFLAARLDDKRIVVRLAAIEALGTLRDPKAIASLQKFATASRSSPQRATADRALSELRSVRKPADDFKNLRQEVLDLQQQNRDLRKDLDDLRKKFEAAAQAQPAEQSPKPPTKPTAAKLKAPKPDR